MRLHHVFQGEYLVLDYNDFDGAERNICRGCVDKIRGWGKSEILNKVGYFTVYVTDESEKDKEELEGTLLGGGGDDVSIMLVV